MEGGKTTRLNETGAEFLKEGSDGLVWWLRGHFNAYMIITRVQEGWKWVRMYLHKLKRRKNEVTNCRGVVY